MNKYQRFHYPPEIIQHVVWIYHRFNLSHRDLEDLLSERGMRKFKSITQAQRFFSTHAEVYNLFNFGHHLLSAKNYRMFRECAFASWEKVVII